jgi:hypothetical protein
VLTSVKNSLGDLVTTYILQELTDDTIPTEVVTLTDETSSTVLTIVLATATQGVLSSSSFTQTLRTSSVVQTVTVSDSVPLTSISSSRLGSNVSGISTDADESEQATTAGSISSMPTATVTISLSPDGIPSATGFAILVSSLIVASLIVLGSCCFCFHRLDRRRAQRLGATSSANAAVEGEQDILNELDGREIHQCDSRDVFEADSEQRAAVNGQVACETHTEKADNNARTFSGHEAEVSGAALSNKNEASLQEKAVAYM